MKKAFLLCVLALTACATPAEDSQNSMLCRADGFNPGTEDFTICRQWRNSELVANEPDNFGLFPHYTFSEYACGVYHKKASGTPAHAECSKKYDALAAMVAAQTEEMQKREVQAVFDADSQKCTAYGLSKGTKPFADCMMKQEEMRIQATNMQTEAALKKAQLKLQAKQLMDENYNRMMDRNMGVGDSVTCVTNGNITTCN